MSGFKKEVNWLSTTNIYEVNIRQYTHEGTFNAFAKHLPRLKQMGVAVLWLMPITPIAAEKQKGSLGSPYACADYTSINPEFGSMDDFKKLVLDAHQLGLKIIIDWVANHTGWGHTWTKTNPDYYKREDDSSFKVASGMDDIIELDYDNSNLRLAMINAMRFWIDETGIDGFRCDLAAWVPVSFWQQARPELEKIKPIFWLGEFDELDNPDYGEVFDVSYSWAWMHLTKDFADGNKNLNDLWELLKRYSGIGDTSMRAWFTSNHDENSWNGSEYEKYGKLALPLAVFSSTWNGVPLMYSGQEMPLLKRLSFFDKDAIEWNDYLELEDFYKKLLDLKTRNEALNGGDASVSTYIIENNESEKVMSFGRIKDEHKILVILNMSESDLNLYLKLNQFKGNYINLFTSEMMELNDGIALNAYDYKVFFSI